MCRCQIVEVKKESVVKMIYPATHGHNVMPRGVCYPPALLPHQKNGPVSDRGTRRHTAGRRLTKHIFRLDGVGGDGGLLHCEKNRVGEKRSLPCPCGRRPRRRLRDRRFPRPHRHHRIARHTSAAGHRLPSSLPDRNTSSQRQPPRRQLVRRARPTRLPPLRSQKRSSASVWRRTQAVGTVETQRKARERDSWCKFTPARPPPPPPTLPSRMPSSDDSIRSRSETLSAGAPSTPPPPRRRPAAGSAT